MLCPIGKTEQFRPHARFLPIFFLNIVLGLAGLAWTPAACAQGSAVDRCDPQSPAAVPLKVPNQLASPARTVQNRATVSVHELKIPGKALGEYRKGLEQLAKNDLAEGLKHFTKATEAWPDYYEAYYEVGAVEMTLRHDDAAMEAFQKAVEVSGGRCARANFGMGYLLYLRGKPDEAEKVVRRGLEVDANLADGFAILGMAQLQLNRPEDAEKSAREALLRNPNYAEAYLVLSDIHGRRREYAEQLQNLDVYLKLKPNSPVKERVLQVREAVQRLLVTAQAQN
jgi:tetratricopeptide (TPR) repeat protein